MAITIQILTGRRITVEADSVLVGRDRSCQVALPDESSLQPIHARIRKVVNRWLIEAQGDWQIQVGAGLPGRMSWLKPGDVIRLTESGPEIIFDEGRVVGQTPPGSAPIPQAQKPTATKPQPVVAVPGVAVAQQAPHLPPQVEEAEPLPPPPLPVSATARSVIGLPDDNRTKPPQASEQPAGLLPPLIGMMVVVGFAVLMGLYGFLPVFTDDLREPTRNGVLLALTLLHNGLAMFGLGQTLSPNRRYGFAVLGSLLALPSWGWLLFTTAPIAVTLLGTLAGLSVGFWGVVVLKNPQVRAQFKDEWMPAEKWWQRYSAPVISGTVGGGALAMMLSFGLLLWLTTGERKPDGYRAETTGGGPQGGSGEQKVLVPDFTKVDYSGDFSAVDYAKGPQGQQLRESRFKASDNSPVVASGFDGKDARFVNHGKMTAFYPDGSKQDERFYYDGKQHGSYLEWHRNGKKAAEGAFKNDKEHGKWLNWHENGTLQGEWYYLNGKRHGVSKHWFNNGKKSGEVTWVDGKRHGPCTQWDSQGNINLEVTFSQGRYDREAQPRNTFVKVLRLISGFDAASKLPFRYDGRCKLSELIETFGKPDKEAPGVDKDSRYWTYQCQDGKLKMLAISTKLFRLNDPDGELTVGGDDNFPPVKPGVSTRNLTKAEFSKKLSGVMKRGSLTPTMYVICEPESFFQTFGLPEDSTVGKGTADPWVHRYPLKDGSVRLKLIHAGNEMIVQE